MSSTSGPTSTAAGVPDINSYDHQQKPEDMIGSLLAGVSLTSSYPKEDAPTGVDWGSSSLHQTNRASSYNGAGGANNNNPATNQSANPNSGSFGNGQPASSRSQLLFGTDMNDLQEPTSPIRKKSIDLFLSQSPSQTLGEEVYQLQQTMSVNQGTASSNQGLNGWSDKVRGPPVGAPSPMKEHHAGGRRLDSPPTSVTGTSASSRSASPSLYSTIQAYGRPNADPPRMSQRGSNGQLNGTGGSQYPAHDVHGMQQQNNVLHQTNQQPQVMDQYSQQVAQQQPQMGAAGPQVLYMAVPTPDGRGQMLQAVQMVQMPGGAQTFVLPPSAQFPQTNDAAAQPMMVLPSAMQQQSAGQSQDSNKGGQWGSAPSQQYSRNTDINGQYAVDRGGGGDDYMNNNVYMNSNGGNVNASGGNSPTLPGGAGADAIASLYSAAQRPPLDALLGHVRRLSRDQVGCRLLQQALDEEGTKAATLILNEGIAFWGEAMVDPFGNYLFQKILEKITVEERIMLIKSVSPRLVNASLNLHGTRSVQKVVELCAADEAQWPNTRDPIDGTAAEILTAALCPAAARLCIDSHGNHVIQRVLLKLGHQHSRFVFDAVANSVGDVARHRHGCCVIQRCLDSPPTEARSHLVRRIVQKSLELMQDAYGNYVVQYVLDVCGDEDVHAVCESVAGKVCLLAIQKFSSNVMEKCLERSSDRVKEMYLSELSDTERIRELMMDPFGNYVVQRALSVATHAQAIRLVEAMRPHLISSVPGAPHGQRNGGMRNTAGGRRIMAKICRRFPNFTLTALGSPEELYSQSKGQQRKHQQQGGMPYHQAMSPQHQQPPPQRYGGGGSPHQGQHHAQQQHAPQGNMNGNMRQPYFDAGQGYYDHQQNGHPNYHPHM